MKLTVLTENSVLRSDLKAEHGMSILVQADGINFLFDTGYFGAIRENAQKLGIDLTNIDVVAFSHNHVDHTGGFLSICDLIPKDHLRECLSLFYLVLLSYLKILLFY